MSAVIESERSARKAKVADGGATGAPCASRPIRVNVRPDDTSVGSQSPANGEGKPRKLTYKEQRELETLEKDIEALTDEKTDLESKLQGGLTDVAELQAVSARFSEVSEKLDALETRWLELSI